jgi:hypothetical protein
VKEKRMLDELESLVEKVRSTAGWRRAIAPEHPDDPRNVEAAANLEQLAAALEDYEGTEIGDQINQLGAALPMPDAHIRTFEILSAELRAAGFRPFSGSRAREFLEWYRDLLQKELARR